MTIKDQILLALSKISDDLGVSEVHPSVSYPPDPKRGDYSTNLAMMVAKKMGKNPMEVAEEIVHKLKSEGIEKVEAVKPGFINIWVNQDALRVQVDPLVNSKRRFEISKNPLSGKKIMVEYAHPNTHKEMHIGHMRTLITGESLARLFEAAGAEVFRANYQGDIGLHVAKALFGISLLLEEQKLVIEDVAKQNNFDKARFLGQAYARGNQEYDQHKDQIDKINKALYDKIDPAFSLYRETRQWSLDYFTDFYVRFYTKFDRLFFESESAALGKKIVGEHVGKIFEEQNGAVVFPGEKYGLHTRVFITNQGNPTYEGKDIGLGFIEFDAFAFDRNIHVVANEQTGYFQVVIKALQMIDSGKFKGEYHLPMGMVQLKDRKMSSRTGDVLTIDWLLDQVKEKVEQMAREGRITADEKESTIEKIVIGAVKYSILKVSVLQDAAFDIETSVSLDGNSGPYLQYTYARARSVLTKVQGDKGSELHNLSKLETEERQLLRLLARFSEVVFDAAEKYAPHILCAYLFELAQAFNLFYQKCPILSAVDEVKDQRLFLTNGTGQVIKQGLNLLGIKAPESM